MFRPLHLPVASCGLLKLSAISAMRRYWPSLVAPPAPKPATQRAIAYITNLLQVLIGWRKSGWRIIDYPASVSNPLNQVG
jgi:hypothetical protein